MKIPQEPAAPVPDPGAAASVQGADPDDGLAAPVDPSVQKLAGHYRLLEEGAEDRGCPVELHASRTIGGYALQTDEACVAKFALGEDLQAWFVASDGQLIFVDATRQPLLKMLAIANGPSANQFSDSTRALRLAAR